MQPIEITKTQKTASQKYWETKGVKFVKSKCIPMSLSGAMGEERDSWLAYYKKEYLASGGNTLESIVDWMDQKKDKMLQRMLAIKAKTKRSMVVID